MRTLRLAGIATILALPLSLSSQVRRAGENSNMYNHGEFTAYGDYFRFAPPATVRPTSWASVAGPALTYIRTLPWKER